MSGMDQDERELRRHAGNLLDLHTGQNHVLRTILGTVDEEIIVF